MTSPHSNVIEANTYAVADVRRWVRTKLDLEPTSDLNATRLRLLHELAEENFVPAITHQQMAWVLEEEATGLSKVEKEPSYYRADRQQELAADVAKFAANFFEMTPALRLAHWVQLRTQVKGYLPLEAWLDHLHPAVSMEVPNLISESETLQIMLRQMREIFVLTPPQQAARRRELVTAADFKEWSLQKAMERARFNYSAWVKLAPGYLEALETHDLQDAQVELAKIANAQREAAKLASKNYDPGATVISKYGWIIGVIAVAIVLLHGFDPNNEKPVHPVNRSNQIHTTPSVELPVNERGKVVISVEQLPKDDEASRKSFGKIFNIPADKIEFQVDPSKQNKTQPSSTPDKKVYFGEAARKLHGLAPSKETTPSTPESTIPNVPVPPRTLQP